MSLCIRLWSGQCPARFFFCVCNWRDAIFRSEERIFDDTRLKFPLYILRDRACGLSCGPSDVFHRQAALHGLAATNKNLARAS